ncbi:MAG: RNase adapter RapZ [Clostridia bacterium]|nr:RNase adapter RapZ [Clostridia bacterium]
MELMVVTGLSGAGKSTGVKVLEDIGYYCIDNMPVFLVSNFVELCQQSNALQKVALVIDSRGSDFFDRLDEMLQILRNQKLDYKILYFEASDETLEHRYKETRRNHPLQQDQKTILQAIREERELLIPLRRRADYIIDSTLLTAAQLRERMTTMFLGDSQGAMRIHVMSFGFKYGIPTDADIVIDVRCLPNPYYVDELRHLTGLDQPIIDFVMQKEETVGFISRFEALLSYMIPLYCNEGKNSLQIAVGCTGGKHRSVALAEHFCAFIGRDGHKAAVSHRDIHKN